MLATLGGILALLAGLAVLLVPLLVPELSRPRDAFWGALVLLLGLVLVTSAERLSGAPMLAVLCGGLLIGRLGSEVSLGRWRQLSAEEQQRFWAPERWSTSLSQLGGSAASLLSALLAGLAGGAGWLQRRATTKPKPKTATKRWVRPEEPEEREENQAEPPPAPIAANATAGDDDETAGASIPTDLKSEPETAPETASELESGPASTAALPAADPGPPVAEVRSFEEIDVLLQQALAAERPREPDAPGDAAGKGGLTGSESPAP